MKPVCTLALALAALLPETAGAQGKVTVVDDFPGPGVDQISIQAAVLAAAEGDTILIKHGTYLEHVEIDGKSLTLVAEAWSHVLLRGRLIVRDLAPEQSVVLRGLHVEWYAGGDVPLQVLYCTGSVWLEGVHGMLIGGLPCASCSTDIMHVEGSGGVTLVDTTLQGMDESPALLLQGAALRCMNSDVALYDCTIIGNAGKEPGACGFDPAFTPGGHGIHCFGGFLFSSGSTLAGGKGGDGTCCPTACSKGADGGSGVLIQPGAALTYAFFLDTTSAAGPGGAGGACALGAPCGDGVAGLDYEVLAGNVSFLPGPSLSMTASSPIREGATVAVDVHGPPGVAVFLGIGSGTTFEYFPLLSGLLIAAGPYAFIDLGALGAAGELHAVLPILFMPPAFESMTFYGQAAYLDPLGAITLGRPTAVTLLDQAF